MGSVPFGYHSLDTMGAVREIDDTELRSLGYARDEVVGKLRFTDFLLPQDVDRFERDFARLKECASVHDLEYEIRRKDGAVLFSADKRHGDQAFQ